MDGAALFFRPSTGTHVRVESDATRGFRRRAPRVAMFGITNRCNLACAFCSRDVGRASEWTIASAYEVLAGLAAAGTLEVAFGGGEPFVFRGFGELVRRLRDTTPLAVHVTTNGALLETVDWADLAGAFGIVRLSVYDEAVDWRAAGALLSHVGQPWGGNVLVDDAALPSLPEKLATLASLGARDVSLLSYVGAGAVHALSPAGEAELARIALASPLAVRLSVCLGARAPVPRLFAGADDSGDCGAGVDFVSITPDRRVQSCSFQETSFPIATAEDVLRVWNEQRDALGRASPRTGCARSEGASRRPRGPTRDRVSVRVWQSFSGNNSGECVMVARFATAADAEKYLAELLPGFVPDAEYSAAWRELFVRERVDTPALEYAEAPQELLAAGRSVLATTYAADDAFPELRALAWKRGGEVLGGGIHLHEDAKILFVAHARAQDAEALRAALVAKGALPDGAVAVRHGAFVFGATSAGESTGETVARVRAIAGDAVAFELFDGVDEAALIHEAKRLATPPSETERMAFWFWAATHEERITRATDFARTLATDATVARAVNTIVAEDLRAKRRLAVLGHRAGASVLPLRATRVQVIAQMWRDAPPRTKGKRAPAPPVVQVADIERALEPRLRAALAGHPFSVSYVPGPTWRQGVSVRVETDAPRAVYEALAALTAEMPDVSFSVGVADTSHLAFALHRLIDEARA